LNRIPENALIYIICMAANVTLLCIHRDPSQLSWLQENGYDLATATNGSEGLRLFMSRPVDAVVLEYHLGLLNGAAIADEIKQVRPQVPVVMLADHVELPANALKSVDALVVKSDGPHFLLATVHFVLNVKRAQLRESKPTQAPAHLRRPGRSREGTDRGQASRLQLATDGKDKPLAREVWRGIRDGTLRF